MPIEQAILLLATITQQTQASSEKDLVWKGVVGLCLADPLIITNTVWAVVLLEVRNGNDQELCGAHTVLGMSGCVMA